jgi:hypothetical protein
MEPEEIRAELEKVAGSISFKASPQLQRLLRYIVEETLAGKSGALKETVVAAAVFDRAGFDPKADSIVRSEARRLRYRLMEYYYGEGARDPVRIDIPKGGYVPTFVRWGTATA